MSNVVALPRRSARVTCRVSPLLYERIRTVAEAHGDTISLFVERAIRYELQREANAHHVKVKR